MWCRGPSYDQPAHLVDQKSDRSFFGTMSPINVTSENATAAKTTCVAEGCVAKEVAVISWPLHWNPRRFPQFIEAAMGLIHGCAPGEKERQIPRDFRDRRLLQSGDKIPPTGLGSVRVNDRPARSASTLIAEGGMGYAREGGPRPTDPGPCPVQAIGIRNGTDYFLDSLGQTRGRHRPSANQHSLFSCSAGPRVPTRSATNSRIFNREGEWTQGTKHQTSRTSGLVTTHGNLRICTRLACARVPVTQTGKRMYERS
jgi:hypothetical protein